MTTCAIRRTLAAAALLLAAGPAAAEEFSGSATALPYRYISVDGDDERFRTHHWMNDGYAGGIRSFEAQAATPGGTLFEAGGHALAGQNDFGAGLSVSREGLGFLSFDYSEFRKWYDGSGPVYKFFSPFRVNNTDKELALDVGSFGFTAGFRREGLPALTFGYEREHKDGAKSRLTWGAVKENNITRNIAPSWQDVDEITDAFTVGAEHPLAGFLVSAEQRWEFTRADLFREERNLSSSSVAADKKVRRQDQQPESDLMTTTVNAERWCLNEALHFTGSYRFSHLDNREFESLLEFNEFDVPTSFANPKNKPNARADSDYDSHAWVLNLLAKPVKTLAVITRFKTEAIAREGSSTYPSETTNPPDGVINTTERSLTESKLLRFGESISMRYTGLPRTALYTEMEFEQSRMNLREDRKSLAGQSAADANEVFNRRTVSDVDRATGTVGGQYAPCAWANLTAQLRHRRYVNDYDDQQETAPGASTARSAFIDAQRIDTNEASLKLALRPWRRLQPALRYQLREDDLATRVEAQQSVETAMLSNVYTAEVGFQPTDRLTGTFSYSRQDSVVSTPARFFADGTTPDFHGDSDSWLASADYQCTKSVSVGGSLLYIRANNFNDFSEDGLPLGVDDERLDATARLTWALDEDTSASAEYGFYHYQANSNTAFDDYDAHAVWLEISRKL